VLSHWGTPFEELDVATGFGQTHVIASGPLDGPAVVLLHAYFATAASWYRTAAALSETYRTFAVDVLGEPNKSQPVRPIRTLDDYGQWFTELADGLGLTQMHLVGNSMGGFGASYRAIHLAGRVRKLALISPAGTFHRIIPFYTHLFLPKEIYLFLALAARPAPGDAPGRQLASRQAPHRRPLVGPVLPHNGARDHPGPDLSSGLHR
jgi:pimeloyl-ACP methyl ester carboxylesterase